MRCTDQSWAWDGDARCQLFSWSFLPRRGPKACEGTLNITLCYSLNRGRVRQLVRQKVQKCCAEAATSIPAWEKRVRNPPFSMLSAWDPRISEPSAILNATKKILHQRCMKAQRLDYMSGLPLTGLSSPFHLPSAVPQIHLILMVNTVIFQIRKLVGWVFFFFSFLQEFQGPQVLLFMVFLTTKM